MSFESKLSEGKFCIPECNECKKIVWPPSETCSHCFGNVHLKEGEFEGKIIEFSRQKDQYFCMVKFENTIRVMANMSEKPQIGKSVKISKCGLDKGSYFFQVN